MKSRRSFPNISNSRTKRNSCLSLSELSSTVSINFLQNSSSGYFSPNFVKMSIIFSSLIFSIASENSKNMSNSLSSSSSFSGSFGFGLLDSGSIRIFTVSFSSGCHYSKFD
eukprot:UN05010